MVVSINRHNILPYFPAPSFGDIRY